MQGTGGTLFIKDSTVSRVYNSDGLVNEGQMAFSSGTDKVFIAENTSFIGGYFNTSTSSRFEFKDINVINGGFLFPNTSTPDVSFKGDIVLNGELQFRKGTEAEKPDVDTLPEFWKYYNEDTGQSEVLIDGVFVEENTSSGSGTTQIINNIFSGGDAEVVPEQFALLTDVPTDSASEYVIITGDTNNGLYYKDDAGQWRFIYDLNNNKIRLFLNDGAGNYSIDPRYYLDKDGMVVLKSTNNVFRYEDRSPDQTISADGSINTSRSNTGYIRVNQGEIYSHNNGTNQRFNFYDFDKSTVLTSTLGQSAQAPTGAKWMTIEFSLTFNYNNLVVSNSVRVGDPIYRVITHENQKATYLKRKRVALLGDSISTEGDGYATSGAILSNSINNALIELSLIHI